MEEALALAVALSETTAPQADFFAWVFAMRAAVSPTARITRAAG
jgi:hypothetical protein